MLKSLLTQASNPKSFLKSNLFPPHRLSKMSSAYTILADDCAIEKPLLDDRSYRFLKLNKNDLHVLVINDPTTDRSAASMDVNVGSFADKKYTISGLAHFCEHLLFMGTAKFPEENEYASYLSKHSGHSNAYTSAEHTNYYFEVSSEHLEGALDRFSQFFISPLFSKSCKDREIRAVDSENKKNLQNDLWRMYQLDKSTSNPNHPFNGFSTGNYATLNDEPESRGLNVRDVLLDFYREQYSSNLMSLVVLGSESLDDLTAWAIEKFSDIPNASLPRPSYDGELIFTSDQLGKILKAKSIMDINKLELSFMIPDDMERHWESKPSQYFSHLLGHESNGSLCHFLKNKNWINSLSSGNMTVCRGNSLFVLEVELTPSGLENWQEVVVHVFEYLKLLHNEEPQQWIWKEISDMSKINFRFKQKSATSSTVSKMSNSLYKFASDQSIPPENLLNYTIISDFDPEKIKKLRSYLVPSNVRLTLSSQRFDDLPSKEHWYGSEYSFSDIPQDLNTRIRNVSTNKELHLVLPNKFVPQDFTVSGEKLEKPLGHPYLISNTAKHETWFKSDDTFMVPKGNINLTVHCPVLGNSITESVLGMLWTELLDDELNDVKYYASIVGLQCSIYHFRDAISVKVGGYNDKLPEFLKQILEVLVDYVPKEDRFDSIKYKITQELKNSGYETPYSQIGSRFLQLVNEKTYTDDEKLEALDHLTYKDVAEFARNNLWSQGVFVQTLVHGNFSFSTAHATHNLIHDIFRHKNAVASTREEVDKAVRFQSVRLNAGENVRYEIQLKDANNVNSCLEYFIQVGSLTTKNARLRVLTDLLSLMIHEPCFNQLRTKEQLGYVVFSGYRSSRSEFGVRILVQSERSCEYLEYRVEEFLKRFREKNLGSQLTDEAFERFKNALKSKKLSKLKNLQEECARFWNSINDGFYDFQQKKEDVNILETITKDEFLLFFKTYIDVGANDHSARLSVFLKSQRPPEVDETKAVATAVHNFIFKSDIVIGTDAADKILADSGPDLNQVAEKIAQAAELKDKAAFQSQFVAEVTARVREPVPPHYPKGTLIASGSEFKASHELGGRPEPVRDLETFYYRYEESHL